MSRDVTPVTFLVPTYNGMPYVRLAVTTILAQPQPWSMLAVDDGSTDGTWDYLQTIAADNVRVVRNTRNLGLYGTLNTRVHEVSTPWTALVFQDDALRPGYLDAMNALKDRHPDVPMFWPAIDTILHDGAMKAAGLNTGREERITPDVTTWRDTLVRGTYWTISGSFSRTTTLQQLGFRPDLPHMADFDLLLRATRVVPLVYLERALVAIREHQGQASARNLTSGTDLDQRLRVILEQLSRWPGEASPGFRLNLAASVAHETFTRALGAARHGRWGLLRNCVRKLPRAAAIVGAGRRRRGAGPGPGH
jgi:glycosyltransferase involved in cell wall biosynthesis